VETESQGSSSFILLSTQAWVFAAFINGHDVPLGGVHRLRELEMTREGRGGEAGDEHIAGKEDVHGKDRENIARRWRSEGWREIYQSWRRCGGCEVGESAQSLKTLQQDKAKL
jgi:hypothetical protein